MTNKKQSLGQLIYCPKQEKDIPVLECDVCSFYIKELFQREGCPEAKCVAHLVPDSLKSKSKKAR